MIGGVARIWVVGGGGGHMSLDHFVLRFIGVFRDVGGATCVNIARICRLLAMVFICYVCLSDPINVFLWCVQSI